MMIDIVIIVGAASGVIVFNFILVTWCLFYQRKQVPTAQVELQTTALQKRSSLLKGKRTVRFGASLKDPRNKYASCPASRLPIPYVPSPLASAKVRTRRSDRPQVENLFPQNLSTTVPTITSRVPSVYSDDSASVYSTASAPLEVHDHLSRSPNTISVTLASSASKTLSTAVTSSRKDLVFPSCTGDPLSVMEEGLNHNQVIQLPKQASRRVSQDQSAWGMTPNRLLPPGLVVSPPPTAGNIEQGPPSTPLPLPYSPPSRW